MITYLISLGISSLLLILWTMFWFGYYQKKSELDFREKMGPVEKTALEIKELESRLSLNAGTHTVTAIPGTK